VSERLYYEDPYLQEFDAEVVRGVALDDGRTAAVLDRTAFYPTSGGQPYDTGSLGAASVLEVIDGEADEVLHVVDWPLTPGPVHGRIDFERRFDHMQQHTGQHVLSAAFARLFSVRTESFHLGAAVSTIDLAREVTPAEIDRAEHAANRVVWEDRPVTIRYADADEVARLPLRKESARSGRLRLIEVDGFDLSACGGTHVQRTGAIGVIAMSGWERFRGGTRVEFLCGARALRSHHELRDIVVAATRVLSVTPPEVSGAIDRIQTEAKEVKRRVKELEQRQARFDADGLATAAEQNGTPGAIVAAVDRADANLLKIMATRIAERPGRTAVLLSAPAPSSVVVARSADVQRDAAAVLKQLVARFGGKGGGRPELAQGGGLSGDIDAIVAFAREITGS
jgi:alanyl-tRNA synthetase